MVLREHLTNQTPVGKICELHNIQPNLFYLWKKELYARAVEMFTQKKNNKVEGEKIKRLEEKIKD